MSASAGARRRRARPSGVSLLNRRRRAVPRVVASRRAGPVRCPGPVDSVTGTARPRSRAARRRGLAGAARCGRDIVRSAGSIAPRQVLASTSVWPSRWANVWASVGASCDFWVRRFGSMQSVPSRCGRSVAERCLEVVDSMWGSIQEAQSGIIQRQAGAQPLDAEGAYMGPTSELQWMIRHAPSASSSHQRHEAHDGRVMQADSPREGLRGRGEAGGRGRWSPGWVRGSKCNSRRAPQQRPFALLQIAQHHDLDLCVEGARRTP